MWIFLRSIVHAAAVSSWSDLGTNGLGWVIAVFSPIVVVIMKTRHAPRGEKLAYLRAKWVSEIRDTFFFAVIVCSLIFVWELFWDIPHQIWTKSDSISRPALVFGHFPPPQNSALVPSVSITRSITFGNSITPGTAVPTGTTPSTASPSSGTIISATLTGTLSGGNCSAVIDVWKVNAAIPTVANTITASDLPTLANATYYQDTALTGWSTGKTISKNDVLMANVNSATCDNWNLVLAVQIR